jgi:hypothetical protein
MRPDSLRKFAKSAGYSAIGGSFWGILYLEGFSLYILCMVSGFAWPAVISGVAHGKAKKFVKGR